MLALRPNCEFCDKELPPDSTQACICSYECTFCRDCVESILANVCPNCGGGFTARPIRPQVEHRPGISLTQHPASQTRVNTGYSHDEINEFKQPLIDIPAAER